MEESERRESQSGTTHNSENGPFVTFNGSQGTPGKKDLSPIIEGSSESSEESKSHAMATTLGASSHHASSLKTPAASRQQAHSFDHLASSSRSRQTEAASQADVQHVIDTACYIPAEPDEKVFILLSVLVLDCWRHDGESLQV
jgi:hypothetical protein